ncbi:MAG: Fic family protein, partial [Planctomycetaceae bacterium]|nr:Fic family protein [Planctomycetaceae bacterium]
MPTYIHQCPDWPRFRWAEDRLAGQLAAVRHRQGRLLGRMDGLGFDLRSRATLQTLTEDVVESSGIEGEVLDRGQVRSSLARRLGIDIGALAPADRNVDGVVEMILDATQHHERPLTQGRLFGWHAALFPTGYSGLSRIAVGRWRDDGDGPMQVVSGPPGRQRIHYEAPAAARLPEEIKAFLRWFEGRDRLDPVLKAGIAHFWFVTIHPFEDGNGRIARAIADMALARADGSTQRFYSMSAQIRRDRKAYYDVLERSQKGDVDITLWLEWFVGSLDRAIGAAEGTLGAVVAKGRFWERVAGEALNERQILMINRLLDGFEGKLTTSKWAKLTHSSTDTALRDITGLVERRILTRSEAGGRSTSY